MSSGGVVNKEWHELDRQQIVDLYKEMDGVRIAEKFGVTPGAVYYKLRMYGVNPARRSRSFNPPIEEVRDLYSRMSMGDIAKHYGVGETTVFMFLKRNDIGGISRSDRLTGKPKSLEHRVAMSESLRASGRVAGENNPNWKGGKTSANIRGRSKSDHFAWKNSVLSSAQWKCEECGTAHGSICSCCGHKTLLHAHHIESYAEHPEKRYDPKNGKALCEQCHWKVHH